MQEPKLNDLGALPQTPFSKRIDPVLVAIGNGISWIWVLLLAVIVCNVVLRYAFGEGRVEFEEIQWHLYSVGFMLGLGYALQADAHMRVDVLHERLRPRTQAWIELYGSILFVLPFVALMLIYGAHFVADSFLTNEVSARQAACPTAGRSRPYSCSASRCSAWPPSQESRGCGSSSFSAPEASVNMCLSTP